jgi:acyl-CoA hydrolase
VASAYLVFVAVDKNGRRVEKIPPVEPQTPDEIRRYEGALRRRENREAEKTSRMEARAAMAAPEDQAGAPR